MKQEQQIFKLHSEYQPTGDQPQAIAELVKGFQEGNQFETLLGVTGSGKIMRAKAYKSHILTKKTTKRTRHLRATAYADMTNVDAIKKMIPYK